MRLLTLDVASQTGWARWAPGYDRPAFGVQPFKGDIIDKGVAFKEWFVGKLVSDKLDHVVVEQFFINMEHSTQDVVEQQVALTTLAGVICRERGVKYERIAVSSWRSRILGVTRAPNDIPKHRRTDWMKRKAVDYCLDKGWPIDRMEKGVAHNAAEALCICEFIRQRDDRLYAVESTPLFARA